MPFGQGEKDNKESPNAPEKAEYGEIQETDDSDAKTAAKQRDGKLGGYNGLWKAIVS